MADLDLRARIREARDHLALFTVLGAALGLVLTRLGFPWQTVSTLVPAAFILLVFLAWLRPRVFPTWRLLELCLCANQRFPATRAIDDAVRCWWRGRPYGLRAYTVARLRVEADLLTGGDDRGGAAEAERSWGQHLHAMVANDRWLGRGAPGADGEADDLPFRTEIPDCLPLTTREAFAGIDRYFKALASIGRADDFFLSALRVKSAYVAPLYLLTGQLAHFDDNWRGVVGAYERVTSIDDPIADEPLRHLRAFQFACWIVWGPSIPVCTCACWDDRHRNAVGFQLGYGDENTSVILYDKDPAFRSDKDPAFRVALRRARRRAARAGRQGGRAPVPPLAVELDVLAVVRRPGSVDGARLCRAQAELLDVDKGRLVLEYRRLDVIGHAGRSYYSAYLWVMFVLEAGPGQLLMRPGEPWRALLPFFVHGNIAETSTYAFLKDRLAHEALAAIEAVVQRPGTPPDVTFVYMSAIDDPGCGWQPLVKDPGERIKSTLQRLLAGRFSSVAARVRVDDASAKLRAEEGSYYAQFFSTCHLPETVGTYFACLEHLGKGQPHGAA
ncbi:MAG: hypothetical protein ACREM3_18900 [Candidatus Rokuibacteriota bacterium]